MCAHSADSCSWFLGTLLVCAWGGHFIGVWPARLKYPPPPPARSVAEDHGLSVKLQAVWLKRGGLAAPPCARTGRPFPQPAWSVSAGPFGGSATGSCLCSAPTAELLPVASRPGGGGEASPRGAALASSHSGLWPPLQLELCLPPGGRACAAPGDGLGEPPPPTSPAVVVPSARR